MGDGVHCLVYYNDEEMGGFPIIARSLGTDTHIGIAFITNIIDIIVQVVA